MGSVAIDVFVRFRKKYIISEETKCWEWTGSKDKDGYGQFSIGNKCFSPHRFSYKSFNGNIPHGMVVRHTCNNRSCVNPEHLTIGTQKQNVQDAINNGAHPSGNNHYKSKISEEDINVIIKMWIDGYDCRSISEKIGKITRGAVTSILLGRSRKYLFNKISKLKMNYPHPEDEKNLLFWKRSENGWVLFKRRKEIAKKVKQTKESSSSNKICSICNREFLSRNKNGIYCSSLCSGQSFRNKNGNSFSARSYRANVKAKKYNSEGILSKHDVSKLFEDQDGKCAICFCDLSISGYHLDHKVSLKNGGNNFLKNIQLLCPKDNLRKAATSDRKYVASDIGIKKN